jgi:two-component system chemotaxis sensor kinase CheA
MDDFEKELKVGFLEEAEQALADTEQCFLLLESNTSDADNLNRIFRLAHNLKGSSKAVGFDRMGAFTHEFETFILKIKNNELVATPKVVSLLLRCNDFLRQMVATLKQDLSADFEIDSWIQEITAASLGGLEESTNVVAEETSNPLEESTQLDESTKAELFAELAEQPLEALPQDDAPAIAEVIPLPIVSPMKSSESSAPSQNHAAASSTTDSAKTQNKSGQKGQDETLRVSVSKIEDLLNTIGEMVILQSVLAEQIKSINEPLLKKTAYQLRKVSKEIQDLSMSLRMVPIKPSFQKMQRIVRDTASTLGKDVGIVLFGEDSELDKTVLEKINDPLVHLVRNSVDHGIESQDLRIAAGKPARGEVKLAAFHQSGKFIIEVSDDGAGLNPEKLMKKATEKGLLKPGVRLTDAEAYNLIFAPGFSTKEQVTDVSGRGVGMDVVKTNITDLGGEVEILSHQGKGSTFRISLPLTLAIIESMIVQVSNHKYVIPMTHISETLQPSSDQLQATQMGDMLLLRGETLPMFRLGDFFQIPSQSEAKNMIAVITRNQGKVFALLVDDILQQSQVVIKQLGPELAQYKGISGSTILGDGKPAFILEPSDLFLRKSAHTSTIKQQTIAANDSQRKALAI